MGAMSDRLRIYLFGEPRFEYRGEPHAFKAPPKTLPMLAYLLLHRRGPIARESLAAALWPDDDQAAAFGNLRRHLHYLSKALPEPAGASWILTDKKSIAWNAQSPYWLDVEAFETESQDRQMRAHAVRLYGGDLYERCSEEWIDFERERLRTLQISNLAQLCAEARERSSYIEALQYAQLMLAADPWREDAVRAIMETRMLLGDRAGALAEYERFAARLQAELQTKPLAETTKTYEGIARSMDACAAAPSPIETRASALVGRRNELATLRDEWQRAARGEGRVVFLGGEAGIGKTTLLSALRNAVLETGGAVLSAASSAQEETSYAAFLGVAHEVGVDFLTPISNDDERLRTFESFAAQIEARARSKPLLLAVEDLHWAGTATLELLRYLILRLASSPVLLVGTYREFEVTRGHPLRALRRQLAKMQRCTSLALSSLDREEVRELALSRAGRHLPDDFIRRIYDRSDGNPLFVIELIRELADGPQDRIPSSIAEIVRERAARLGPRARSLLQTAALAGSSFSAELLSVVSGTREGEVLARLDELVSAHFLRQTEDEAAFSFVHEVIREAVENSVGASAARSTHARLGLALRDLYADRFGEIAAPVASHMERGGMLEEAVDAYLAAADQALNVYAIDEAASHADKARELATDVEDRFRALLVLESVAGHRADRAQQRGYLDELLTLSKHLESAQRAEVLLRNADFSSGESAERQREALQQFEAILIQQPQQGPAYLLRRGEYLSRVGEAHEAKRVLEQALERITLAQDPDALVRCLTTLYLVSLSTGDALGEIEDRVNLARASLEEKTDARLAARLAFIQAAATTDRDPQLGVQYAASMLEHALNAGDVWLEALAHRACGAAATRCMRLGEAWRHLRRSEEITVAAGRTRDLARVRSWQVMLANRCADFAAAESYGEQGVQAAIAIDATDIRTTIVSNLGNTAVWKGTLDIAELRLREALRLGAERGYAQPSTESLLGEVFVAKGNLPEGIARIERAWTTGSPQDDSLGTQRVHVPLILGLAYTAASRTGEAKRLAQKIRTELETFERYYIHPQVYLWSAAQLLSMHGFDEESRAFLQAAQRRREEILATIDDDRTRETFVRFVFNQFIENGTMAADPLHAWFTPYAAQPVTASPESLRSARARPATSRRVARR